MMTRRTIVAGLALASALSGFVVSPPAVAGDDQCGSLLSDSGMIAGTVGAGDDWDWWTAPVAPGTYLVTLVSGVPDADLTVGDGSCGTLCTSATLYGPDACEATTDGWALTIGIWAGSPNPAAYTVTVAPIGPPTTACSDGADNDLDGFYDSGDAGCSSPKDNSEDDAECSTTVGGRACAEVVVGDVRYEYVPIRPGMQEYKVGGLVNEYRFDGIPVHLVCVVVIVRPDAYKDPCKNAGGHYVATLYKVNYVKADAPSRALTGANLLRICDATVTLTLDGVATQEFDVMTECDRTPDTRRELTWPV